MLAAAADTCGFPADERNRQVVVEVRVAVADPGPIEKQRVVEHAAVAFWKLRRFVHEYELAEVIFVDPVEPLQLRRLVLVM
jgi:hypothetical protein